MHHSKKTSNRTHRRVRFGQFLALLVVITGWALGGIAGIVAALFGMGVILALYVIYVRPEARAYDQTPEGVSTLRSGGTPPGL